MIPITYQCGGSCGFTTASKATLATHVEANHRWSRALRPRCPPPVTSTLTRTKTTTLDLTLPPDTTNLSVCPPPPVADSPPLLPSPQGVTTSTVGAARVAARPSAAKRKAAPDHRPGSGPAKRPRPRAKAPPGPPPLPLHPRDPDPQWVPGPRVMVAPPPGSPVPRPRRSPRLGSRQGCDPQGGPASR